MIRKLFRIAAHRPPKNYHWLIDRFTWTAICQKWANLSLLLLKASHKIWIALHFNLGRCRGRARRPSTILREYFAHGWMKKKPFWRKVNCDVNPFENVSVYGIADFSFSLYSSFSRWLCSASLSLYSTILSFRSLARLRWMQGKRNDNGKSIQSLLCLCSHTASNGFRYNYRIRSVYVDLP